jgi:hypothetical protein
MRGPGIRSVALDKSALRMNSPSFTGQAGEIGDSNGSQRGSLAKRPRSHAFRKVPRKDSTDGKGVTTRVFPPRSRITTLRTSGTFAPERYSLASHRQAAKASRNSRSSSHVSKEKLRVSEYSFSQRKRVLET